MSARTRVLEINVRSPESSVGGAEGVVSLVEAGFRDLGIDVAVASIPPDLKASGSGIQAGSQNGNRYLLSGSRLANLQRGETASRSRRLLAHANDLLPSTGYREAREVIQQFKPSLIVTHNTRGLGSGVVRACAESRAKWIHIPHDVQLFIPSGLWHHDRRSGDSLDTGVGQRAYQMWYSRSFRNVDLVLTPSDFLRQEFLERRMFREDQVETLRLPFEGGSVRSAPAAEPIGHPFSSGGLLKVLLLGRLSPHKGFLWALDAMRNSDLEVEVTVCGSGEEGEAIRALAAHSGDGRRFRVQWLGQVDPDERGRALASSHLLLLPSLVHENAPRVILEAKELNTPVLGARVGGIPEFVDEGWTFPPGDSESLIALLKRFRSAVPQSTLRPIDVPSASGYAEALLDRYGRL